LAPQGITRVAAATIIRRRECEFSPRALRM
jgi:hypothetical protein